jgi:hypothetical protein
VDKNAVAAVFGKTKLCKFHILGMCTKGTACGFAHSASEMRALPDLSCTKFCKTLINTGRCDDPNCLYAHNKEQLRDSAGVSFGHGQVLLPAEVLASLTQAVKIEERCDQEQASPGWSSPSCFFERTTSGKLRRAMKSFGSNLALIQEEAADSETESDADHDMDGFHPSPNRNPAVLPVEFTVKNTFLDVAADEPVKLGLRTVKTAGGRLDGLAHMDLSDDDGDEWMN